MKGAFKLAEEITVHLMTMNYGSHDAELGDRLAIMKDEHKREVEIGGRCHNNVFAVIAGHLVRHKEKK